MLSNAGLLISTATAKNCSAGGLLITVCSAFIFLAAFRRLPGAPKGPDWRLLMVAIALFFGGGVLLIFGIVSGEVAKGQFAR